MKRPAIRRFRPDDRTDPRRRYESGVTMILVALAMVAIIAMAALSIDVITLYLAREEAQRSADAAALAAARVISLSGITGDPANSASSWQPICGGSTSLATQAAQAVATQGTVGGTAGAVTVNYAAGTDSGGDCSKFLTTGPFGVNPMVTVQVTRASLPTFFSRMWGKSGSTVNATAAAEVFNPSNSGNLGNQVTGSIHPVQPRCVKPWIIPNRDPLNPPQSGGGPYCDQPGGPGSCNTLVSTSTGSITNKGISLNGGVPPTGIIGERFWLQVNCRFSGTTCTLRTSTLQANLPHGGNPHIEVPPNLEYLPGQSQNPSIAVPPLSVGTTLYQEAVAGCDQTTQYQCGVPNSNVVDLTENPAGSGDTSEGVLNLINQGNTSGSQPVGQDTLGPVITPYGSPTAYPFQILAGTSNRMVIKASLPAGTAITSSPSVVSLPIYDDSAVTINGSGTTTITIVGFLQVFINAADQWGNVDVTVLNVAGCSNGGGPDPVAATAVTGTSPVPIRLITPP